MISWRQCFLQVAPAPVLTALRSCWRKYYGFKCGYRGWRAFVRWWLWVVFECVRHRQRAVIICRTGALGDLVCTLPLGEEIRRRHSGRLLVFVTAPAYREIVLLSRTADLVYVNAAWVYPFTLPTQFKSFGLVEMIYNPRTTDEHNLQTGASRHLIEDLAASCGVIEPAHQPRLYPSADLIKKTRLAYGLDANEIGNRWLIGINGGPSWPVRTWAATNWQKLVNFIHANYNATIIQFGSNQGDGSSEFDRLTGVQSVASRLKAEEIVALVAACDLVVSIDSGPVHLAGAVGTPVIGLFGPVKPSFRLPIDSPSVGLVGDVPCQFCHNQTPVGHWVTGCPHDIICMKLLKVQSVFEAVKAMLVTFNKPADAKLETVPKPRPNYPPKP